MQVRRFKESDPVRQQYAGRQSYGQTESVVCVELHFRQQIAQRDAHEHASGKCNHGAHYGILHATELPDSQDKQCCSEGTHGGENQIYQETLLTLPAAACH